MTGQDAVGGESYLAARISTVPKSGDPWKEGSPVDKNYEAV